MSEEKRVYQQAHYVWLALRMYGCFRLGARIWDLRHLGVPIRSELVTDGDTRYAKYSLEEDDHAGL